MPGIGKYLKDYEGGYDSERSLSPHAPSLSGGLTIGAGLDLSRWVLGGDAETKYKAFIDSAELSDNDKGAMLTLIPALGKKGTVAKELVKIFKDVKISKDGKDKLFDTAYTEVEEVVKSKYGEEYNSLPADMQEVLMTGAYQYGAGSTPGLWKAMKSSQESGDYSAVKGELEEWGDQTADEGVRKSIDKRYKTISEKVDWASLTPGGIEDKPIETELVRDWTRESDPSIVSGQMPDLEVAAKKEEKPSFDVPTALRGMDREEAPREIKPVEDSLVDSMVQDDLEMPDFFKRLGAAIGRKVKYTKA